MKHKFSFNLIHVIAIFLAIVVIWISCPIYALNQFVSVEESSVEWYEKIDPAIYEKAEKKDDKYLVYVFRDDISTETINETVTRETRFDASLYESDKFDTCVVPELERQIALSEQMNQMQSPTTRLVLGEPTALTIEKAKQIEINEYVAAKRGVTKALNTEYNDSFVREHINDTSDIVYRSRYTSTIIAYLTKEDIEACAQSKDVVSIVPYQQSTATAEADDAVGQIGVDSSTGTKSNQYNSGLGYRGDGVKIGVIETGGGVCDTNHPQLSGIVGTQLILLDNMTETGFAVISQTTKHATYVTALIVGQRIEVNGDVYEGVVPDATVYQIPAHTNTDIFNAIQILVDENVSVINLSAGTNGGLDAYTVDDLEVDKLIDATDVTFVTSAGNNGESPAPNVSSPGKAYNAITVGGVATKASESGVEYLPPYWVYDSSSYLVDSFLTNKPDIVAPAQSFAFVNRDPVTDTLFIDKNRKKKENSNEYYDDYYDGTSYAAPLVTGVIAQLHEANTSLIGNPTATKAILLAGADFDAVIGNNNDLWELCYAARVKSGVGFLNAERAVRIAEEGNYQYSVYFMNAASSRYVGRSYICDSVYIPANYKIRVVMTYSKPAEFEDIEEFANGNDMDLDLFYQGETWCESSLTPYNNVEVVEYVVETAGSYTIEVYVAKLMQTSTRVLMDRTVAWYIEPVS